MWISSVLKILDGAFTALNAVLDYWSRQAVKESGIIEERAKSQEKTLERVRISNEVNLEPVASDRHLILSKL